MSALSFLVVVAIFVVGSSAVVVHPCSDPKNLPINYVTSFDADGCDEQVCYWNLDGHSPTKRINYHISFVARNSTESVTKTVFITDSSNRIALSEGYLCNINNRNGNNDPGICPLYQGQLYETSDFFEVDKSSPLKNGPVNVIHYYSFSDGSGDIYPMACFQYRGHINGHIN